EDGSLVTLNANSLIKLSDSWMSEDDREVFLQGEAFFNVVKTSDHRSFKVKTAEGITVEVLGTTFNVNTRRENLTVYLQSGKVNLQSDADIIALLPGQQANYNKALQKVFVSLEDLKEAENRLAWKSNLYIINDLPLSMVARDIEDNFGRQVILLDSTLSNRRVTAKVPAGDINILLKVLAEALEIEIEQKNNQVIINPRR
ncbi:MAG TPA: FecR domain-containing protein, partial [Chryseolinea sp.]|nr:FecR domain-containing protein [Chryseolinea sp.]